MDIRQNIHTRDFPNYELLEVNVKNPHYPTLEEINNLYPDLKMTEKEYNETAQYEYETGAFVNPYTLQCFNDIQKNTKNFFDDWTFAGRSNGWLVFLSYKEPTEKVIEKTEMIVQTYWDNFHDEMLKFFIRNVNTTRQLILDEK